MWNKRSGWWMRMSWKATEGWLCSGSASQPCEAAQEMQTGDTKQIDGVELMEAKAEQPRMTEGNKTWCELKLIIQDRSEWWRLVCAYASYWTEGVVMIMIWVDPQHFKVHFAGLVNIHRITFRNTLAEIYILCYMTNSKLKEPVIIFWQYYENNVTAGKV